MRAASDDVRVIAGAERLSTEYQTFLLDQFGVLHDGKRAYPGARECVRALWQNGAKLWIISNSSRRTDGTVSKLEKLGFESRWFAGAMTSGEVTHGFLTRTARRVVGRAKREDAAFDEIDASSEALRTVAAAMKRGIESRDGRRAKCAHVTWNERGAITLGEEFNEWIEIVDETSEDFDFVLIHGTEAFGRGDDRDCVSVDVQRVKEFIERVAREGAAPLVIANPDFVTVSGDALVTMPGTLGKWYAEARGTATAEGMVALMGKPDAIIYKALLGKIGRESGAVIAVGDSMEHDVAGARRAGIDALFICGGIHATELSDGNDGVDEAALRALYEAHDSTPRYASWRLEW